MAPIIRLLMHNAPDTSATASPFSSLLSFSNCAILCRSKGGVSFILPRFLRMSCCPHNASRRGLLPIYHYSQFPVKGDSDSLRPFHRFGCGYREYALHLVLLHVIARGSTSCVLLAGGVRTAERICRIHYRPFFRVFH